ncbi:helix-turn-helix transcriptional regulator [Actinomycetota bacterium Odt1-20B]
MTSDIAPESVPGSGAQPSSQPVTVGFDAAAPDEAVTSMRAHYPGQEMQRIGGVGPDDRFRLHIQRLSAGGLSLIRFVTSGGLTTYYRDPTLYSTAAVRAGTFGIRQQGATDLMSTPGQEAPQLMVPGADAIVEYGEATSLFFVGARAELLEGTLARLLEHPVQPLQMTDPAPPAGHFAVPLPLLTMLETELAYPSGLLDPGPVGDRLRETVITALLYGTTHQYSDELRNPTARVGPRTLTRALQAMEADPTHPFTLAELARIAGVGPRALQNAFRDHRGTTPLAHLRYLRLRGAHRELLASAPPATVTEIAARWGFTHAGRFAQLYQSQYGQAPSVTLRARAGGQVPR